MSFSGELYVKLSGKHRVTLPYGVTESSIDDTPRQAINAERMWSGEFELTDSALEFTLSTMADVDSGMGPGRDMLGRPFEATAIVAIMLRIGDDSGGELEVAPGTRPWRGLGSHLTRHGGSLGRGSVLLKSVPSTMPIIANEADQIVVTATGNVKFRLTLFTR